MDESAEAAHLAVMRAVLDKIGREDLLLKGGTALMFGYGIQRVSRDLDFDARRPIRDIEKKLKDLDIDDVTVVGIDTLKNTETITRYRVRYESWNCSSRDTNRRSRKTTSRLPMQTSKRWFFGSTRTYAGFGTESKPLEPYPDRSCGRSTEVAWEKPPLMRARRLS